MYIPTTLLISHHTHTLTQQHTTAYPKHPLKGCNSRNHQTLKQQAQAALAARQAAIQETNTRDDEPDDEGAEDEVDVVEFVAGVLRVDVFGRVLAIPTPGLRWVVGGL